MNRLSLLIRRNLPSSLKLMLRVSRHLAAGGQQSEGMPSDLIADCRMCASRHELVQFLPHGGEIAEIGTEHGKFAQHLLSTCRPLQLHLVDLDFSQLSPELKADSRVHLHEGLSHEKLAAFADDRFDWIYIDADHSYEGVMRDATAAASKVKPGGYLVFNDFAHVDPNLGNYGVHRAVVEFALSRRWPFAWWAYNASALYDVALRRPM